MKINISIKRYLRMKFRVLTFSMILSVNISKLRYLFMRMELLIIIRTSSIYKRLESYLMKEYWYHWKSTRQYNYCFRLNWYNNYDGQKYLSNRSMNLRNILWFILQMGKQYRISFLRYLRFKRIYWSNYVSMERKRSRSLS